MTRILLDPPKAVPQGWTYGGRLHWGWGRSASIHFTLHEEEQAETSRVACAMMLALLLPAMRIGKPVEISAAIDAANLPLFDQLVALWASWYPHEFKRIDIRAGESIPPEITRGNRAIACFSGGVDSCYTMVKHSNLSWLPESERLPLERLLMVHGMDIPLKESEIFTGALARSRKIAGSCNLPLTSMTTDGRRLQRKFKLKWGEHLHGLLLGACLIIAGRPYSHGLIPSTYPAFDPVIPWGSSAASDPLMSISAMRIIHDGDEADKLGKIARIHHVPEIAEHLRVCWEGNRLDRNCGHCFKCTATQLAFALYGNPHPGCFDSALQTQSVEKLKLYNRANRNLIMRYGDFAKISQLHELEAAIRTCLNHNQAKPS